MIDLGYSELLKQKIFEVDAFSFNSLAIEIFHFQYQHNKVYQQYVDLLKIEVQAIKHINQIPFLPISFFKSHVVNINHSAEKIFESSGTTTSIASKHFVSDISLYQNSFIKCFELFFGNIQQYTFLGLLPSYLERNNSSLVYMVQYFMQLSNKKNNGFYLHNYDELRQVINTLEETKQPYLLFGVTYALLQMAEKFPIKMNYGKIIETGGMKGRGKELIREDLHHILKQAFGLPHIYSEYGMTELLSQAYLMENGNFCPPPWMKILIRNTYNPFEYLENGQSGALNVIDLANLFSCCFIETQDTGTVNADGFFEVTGRMDNSEIRGCNLLES